VFCCFVYCFLLLLSSALGRFVDVLLGTVIDCGFCWLTGVVYVVTCLWLFGLRGRFFGLKGFLNSVACLCIC